MSIPDKIATNTNFCWCHCLQTGSNFLFLSKLNPSYSSHLSPQRTQIGSTHIGLGPQNLTSKDGTGGCRRGSVGARCENNANLWWNWSNDQHIEQRGVNKGSALSWQYWFPTNSNVGVNTADIWIDLHCLYPLRKSSVSSVSQLSVSSTAKQNFNQCICRCIKASLILSEDRWYDTSLRQILSHHRPQTLDVSKTSCNLDIGTFTSSGFEWNWDLIKCESVGKYTSGWYSFKATKAYFQMPDKAMIVTVIVIVTAFPLGLLEPSSVWILVWVVAWFLGAALTNDCALWQPRHLKMWVIYFFKKLICFRLTCKGFYRH